MMTMKKLITIFIILFLVVVFACGLHLWIQTSPWLDDQEMLNSRETISDLAMAFATALRINDPAAYEMIDPSLKTRLDAWMNTHQSQRCDSQADSFFVRSRPLGTNITFSCSIKDNYLVFEVDNILVMDMKVIDWGKVTDEDWAGNELK